MTSWEDSVTDPSAGACVMYVCDYADVLFLILLSCSVFAAVFFWDFTDWLEEWLQERGLIRERK